MDFRLLYTFHTHASIFIEQIYYSYYRALNATTVNSGNRFIYSCSLGGWGDGRGNLHWKHCRQHTSCACTWIVILRSTHQNSLWNKGKSENYLNTNFGPCEVSEVIKRKLYLRLELLILKVIVLSLDLTVRLKLEGVKSSMWVPVFCFCQMKTRKETDSDYIFYWRAFFFFLNFPS